MFLPIISFTILECKERIYRHGYGNKWQMILHSGNSRGDSSEAIECLKEKQFDKATELLENAKSELLLAQKNSRRIVKNNGER